MLDAIRDKTFRHETIRLDDNMYVNCLFEECVLLYGGGACEWETTYFKDCRVVLNGSASITMQVLKALGVELTASETKLSVQ